ncbi:hypothetical protein [Halobacillus litoralis]|uniref:hypothetical protein n=1 Tax=Halobacillus litoralis TaxID=45668 RepID=UPI001CD70EF5|nr:hypothetical protein [Halobacillus litoralis]MCA1021666.1 hypothetical protein [Halobacillus litoralis]
MANERTDRERIVSLEDKTAAMEKTVENLKAHTGVSEKLVYMYEQQQNMMETQQENTQRQFEYFKDQLDKQHDRDEKFLTSLGDISENMIHLNHSVKETKKETEGLSDRVGMLENESELKKEAVRGWLKDMFFKFLVPILLFLITGFLAYLIGWKG